MFLSADIKSLEIVTAAYLSRDPVLCQEVRDKAEFHVLNQQRFGLPDKVTAKRFVFKLIYGATAYGYANDGDFIGVSTSQKYWQEVIDEFYSKYRGVKQWHEALVQSTLHTGVYEAPSGRRYLYPAEDVAKRLWYWRPKILNYPVQGLGADLVMLARISLWKRLCQNLEFRGILPVSSVHDSIVLDVPSSELDKDDGLCYTISKELKKVVNDVPANFQRCFNKEFDLPLDASIKIGNNLGDMKEIETTMA